jgi:predicted amidohydrolase YtcJ
VDLLVVGRIVTLDPARPEAPAALARDGRWVRVGARAGCERASREAARLELGDAVALPGLCDAHGHPLLLGRALSEVDCRGAASPEECAARAAARALHAPAGAWIRGRGWDQNRWPGGAYPTAAVLTRAVPDHPVVLTRVDGHAGWANAPALARAGIGAATPDPPGGRILRGPGGAPEGVLVDAAFEDLLRAIPPATAAEVEAALRLGLDALARAGLTEIHDAGVTPEILAAYRGIARALPVRVYAMLDGQAPPDELEHRVASRGAREDGLLTVGALKLFADGALGSRGAALLAPYADDPSTSGLLLLEPDELRRRLRVAARAGLQPAVHAIGDRACREVLRAFAELREALAPLRPRVEHLELLAPDDLPLLREAGAIASMQPTHATSDAPWLGARLGDRPVLACAWRSALDAGAPLALGSDFPIEDPDPRAGIDAAVRRTPAGAALPWDPAQRLTPREALAGFTGGAAYAAFADGRRGRVRVGFDADLTLLGEDLLAAADVRRVPVLGTVLAGVVRAWGHDGP